MDVLVLGMDGLYYMEVIVGLFVGLDFDLWGVYCLVVVVVIGVYNVVLVEIAVVELLLVMGVVQFYYSM